MNEYITIPLSTTGKNSGLYETIISKDDEILASQCWQACVYKHKETIYARGRRGRTLRFLHDIILERMLERPLEEGEQCDHIDGNGLNNSRENLRKSDGFQNQANRFTQKNNTVGFKGVNFDKKSGRYRARIAFMGKRYNLGLFSSPEEAHKAYCEKGETLHGVFFNGG